MNFKSICIGLLTLTSFAFAGKRKAQGKATYGLDWSEGFKDCENFNNNILLAKDLEVIRSSPTTSKLSGNFELTSPIIAGTQIIITIEKETPQGKVLFTTLDITELCDHVEEDNMPWTIFFDAMKLDPRKCPLPARVYDVNNLKLRMGLGDSILNHENVGEYVARLDFQHQGEGLDVVEHTLACYLFSFSIVENRESSD